MKTQAQAYVVAFQPGGDHPAINSDDFKFDSVTKLNDKLSNSFYDGEKTKFTKFYKASTNAMTAIHDMLTVVNEHGGTDDIENVNKEIALGKQLLGSDYKGFLATIGMTQDGEISYDCILVLYK